MHTQITTAMRRFICTAATLCTAVVFPACHSESRIDFPAAPQEMAGVSVTLHSTHRTGVAHFRGLRGTARNVSGHDLQPVLLRFEITDDTGKRAGEAVASRPILKKDESWEFVAAFGSSFNPWTFKSARLVEVDAFR